MNQLNAGVRATPAEEDKKEVCDFATNHTSSYKVTLTLSQKLSEGLVRASASVHSTRQVGLLKEPVQVEQSQAAHTSEGGTILHSNTN